MQHWIESILDSLIEDDNTQEQNSDACFDMDVQQ